MNAKPDLVRHGLTLFLAGLATGFIVPLTRMPRQQLRRGLLDDLPRPVVDLVRQRLAF